MTFCVGMRLKEGIIGLADNLIVTGNEAIRAKKVTTHRAGDNSFFLMTSGLRIAYLAFDSSRINAIDVDFPIDMIVYRTNSFYLEQYRFSESELAYISEWWQEKLRKSAGEMPAEWVRKVLNGKPQSAA